MFRLIQKCWAAVPRKRPSFRTLNEELTIHKKVTLATPSEANVVSGPNGLVLPSSSSGNDEEMSERFDFDCGAGKSAARPEYEYEPELVGEAMKRQATGGLIQHDSALELRMPEVLARATMQMYRKIGSGAFGEVWQGTVGRDVQVQIAVKTVRPDADDEAVRELLDEAVLMAQIEEHPNLVGLVGVADGRGPPLVALEYCNGGNLRDLLPMLPDPRSEQPDPAAHDRLLMALHIATGMEHLGTHAGAVHRDLAARNVLVTYAADGRRSFKVSDFGLSRAMAASRRQEGVVGIRSPPQAEDSSGRDATGEEYYYSQAGQFAVRWTALEAIFDKRFTAASDVWSFGVTMTEVFTAGDQPYTGQMMASIPGFLRAGNRMSRPTGCPLTVWTKIDECWADDPGSRPSFSQLVSFFTGELSSYSPPGPEVPAAGNPNLPGPSELCISEDSVEQTICSAQGTDVEARGSEAASSYATFGAQAYHTFRTPQTAGGIAAGPTALPVGKTCDGDDLTSEVVTSHSVPPATIESNHVYRKFGKKVTDNVSDNRCPRCGAKLGFCMCNLSRRPPAVLGDGAPSVAVSSRTALGRALADDETRI